MRSLPQPRGLGELTVGSAFCRSINLPLQRLTRHQFGRRSEQLTPEAVAISTYGVGADHRYRSGPRREHWAGFAAKHTPAMAEALGIDAGALHHVLCCTSILTSRQSCPATAIHSQRSRGGAP
jgi:hypothetical protein